MRGICEGAGIASETLPAMVDALALGATVGLAVAVPLGPVGLLLVGEGLDRGFRAGAPAALGVALVDFAYAVLAAGAGAAAGSVALGAGAWPHLVGGVALVVLAAAGARRTLTTPDAGRTVARRGAGDERGPAWRRLALFVGLTAVNPTTLVTFAAVATTLARTPGPSMLAFAVGVGAASAAWQVGLVAAGALLRRRFGPRARRVTALVGHIVVALLGVFLLTAALR